MKAQLLTYPEGAEAEGGEETLISGGECFYSQCRTSGGIPSAEGKKAKGTEEAANAAPFADELCRPQDSARRTAKGRARLGAHNKMGYGAVTPEHRAFQFDA